MWMFRCLATIDRLPPSVWNVQWHRWCMMTFVNLWSLPQWSASNTKYFQTWLLLSVLSVSQGGALAAVCYACGLSVLIGVLPLAVSSRVKHPDRVLPSWWWFLWHPYNKPEKAEFYWKELSTSDNTKWSCSTSARSVLAHVPSAFFGHHHSSLIVSAC